MNRTITVKGTGAISVSPDQVELRMKLTAEEYKYDRAMQKISDGISELVGVLTALGFEKSDLKTVNFNVRTTYRSVKDRTGSYTSVFNGYECVNDLKLTFDLDSERLSRVLSAVSESSVSPELTIRFTVKNPADAKDALLADAAQNGMRKARILCEAAGAKLGQLISINYNWGELEIYSDTSIDGMTECMPKAACAPAFAADFHPEDINLSDTVTLVWEIE